MQGRGEAGAGGGPRAGQKEGQAGAGLPAACHCGDSRARGSATGEEQSLAGLQGSGDRTRLAGGSVPSSRALGRPDYKKSPISSLRTEWVCVRGSVVCYNHLIYGPWSGGNRPGSLCSYVRGPALVSEAWFFRTKNPAKLFLKLPFLTNTLCLRLPTCPSQTLSLLSPTFQGCSQSILEKLSLPQKYLKPPLSLCREFPFSLQALGLTAVRAQGAVTLLESLFTPEPMATCCLLNQNQTSLLPASWLYVIFVCMIWTALKLKRKKKS